MPWNGVYDCIRICRTWFKRGFPLVVASLPSFWIIFRRDEDISLSHRVVPWLPNHVRGGERRGIPLHKTMR